MAFESGSQGSGLFGRVFTALGNSKAPNLKHIPLSPEGDSAYSNLFKDYNSLLGAQTSGLADFTKSYQSLTPQLGQLDQLHASTYGDLINRATNYDPTANLQTSGNYLFGNLDKYLKTGMDAGNAVLKTNLAAAGYGDRGPGGYSALLNANRITGNLLPAFNNIVSNLTPLTNQQGRDYFQNIAIQPALMQGQNASLEATPYRNLVPAGVQQDLLRGNIGTVNDLVKNQLGNWAFYQKPNAWTTAGNVASGVYGAIFDAADAANKVSSAYGNVMSSGLGNIGGGMSGGQPDLSGGSNLNTGQFPGEVNPQATSALMPSPYQPQNTGAFAPGSIYGGYGVGYGQPPIAYSPPPNAFSPNPQYGGYGVGYSQAPSINPYSPLYAQNPYAQYGAYF